jgi:hypothetical protein
VHQILFAFVAAALTGIGGFGIVALQGRSVVLRTLHAVEEAQPPAAGDYRDQYLILLEARTYPKTYLLFRTRDRVNAALDKLAGAPDFVARGLPNGPSIWHRNIYFNG